MESTILNYQSDINETFKPDDSSFDVGLRKLDEAYKKVGQNPFHKIITSKDEIANELIAQLGKVKTPDGFEKWMLPFSLPGATFYITVGQPWAFVPLHSHSEGFGIRFILSGSIIFNDKELTSGDWFYVPQNAEYSFTVGSDGVRIASGYYSCCNTDNGS